MEILRFGERAAPLQRVSLLEHETKRGSPLNPLAS
jgi:hypothetical protein